MPTFLGSTQEAHMCASWVQPSVTSLTDRSVHEDITRFSVELSKCLLNDIECMNATFILGQDFYCC